MSNIYLCHPDGNDSNGGGYLFAGTAGFTDCHDSFAPVVIEADCAISEQGAGNVRITSGTPGDFSSVVAGTIVYCAFSATYADGRYVIVDSSSDWIDIGLVWSTDIPTVSIRVGGAILSPDEACTLAYGNSNDVLLLPANQTTRTENLVDGSANQVVTLTEGYTLDMYGVDEDTGILLGFDDLWPAIKAKAGSTWAASSAMVLHQDGSGSATSVKSYMLIDKIVLDGNELTPRVLQLGDSSSDYCIFGGGDIIIKNSLQSANSYGVYAAGYTYSLSTSSTERLDAWGVRSIKIINCAYGAYAGRGLLHISEYMWFDDCWRGISNGSVVVTIFTNCKRLMFTNCTVGLYVSSRYNNDFHVQMTFANNNTDIYLDYYNTTVTKQIFRNVLCYNDNSSGICIESDNSTYMEIYFRDSVFGVSGGAVKEYGVSCNYCNCEDITADPFIDKANDDYRLNPDFADLDKIWNWEKEGCNSIGVTAPAEPESGGGVSQLINGGLISCR